MTKVIQMHSSRLMLSSGFFFVFRLAFMKIKDSLQARWRKYQNTLLWIVIFVWRGISIKIQMQIFFLSKAEQWDAVYLQHRRKSVLSKRGMQISNFAYLSSICHVTNVPCMPALLNIQILCALWKSWSSGNSQHTGWCCTVKVCWRNFTNY